MAFVNEYASDEDIEKYGLREIWDKYHPQRQGDYFYGRQPEWTVDREANAFLTVLGIDHGEYGNRIDFLLWKNGVEVKADLELLSDSNGDLNAIPFRRIWGLKRLSVPNSTDISESDITETLRQALTAYGYRGVRNQRPNTIVEFTF